MFSKGDVKNKSYFTKTKMVIAAPLALFVVALATTCLKAATLNDRGQRQVFEESATVFPLTPTAPQEIPTAMEQATALQTVADTEERAARATARGKNQQIIFREIKKALADKKYAIVVGLYKAMLDKDPHNAYLYRYRLGRIYRLMGEYNKELISYRLSLQLNPDNDDVYLAQGEAFERAGLVDEAIASYKMALEVDPQSLIAKQRLKALGWVSNRKNDDP